jgi:uncharacterized protein (DUF433 family)
MSAFSREGGIAGGSGVLLHAAVAVNRGYDAPVKAILEPRSKRTGASEAQILKDFPDLEKEDIRACLQYAAAQADHAVLRAA